MYVNKLITFVLRKINYYAANREMWNKWETEREKEKDDVIDWQRAREDNKISSEK
jgi:hypothetical protein